MKILPNNRSFQLVKNPKQTRKAEKSKENPNINVAQALKFLKGEGKNGILTLPNGTQIAIEDQNFVVSHGGVA